MKNKLITLLAVATTFVGAKASVQSLNNGDNTESLPLTVSQSGGGFPGAPTTNKTIAQSFSVSSGSAVKIPTVSFLGTNNPSKLRITIYANTNVAVSVPPPAIGTYLQPTPNLSKPLVQFHPPIVTSYSDDVAEQGQPSTVWYNSIFKANLLKGRSNVLPASSSPYWVVVSLSGNGTVSLDGVEADSNLTTPYIGAVSTNTAINNGTLQPAPVYSQATPTRAASMGISYKTVVVP